MYMKGKMLIVSLIFGIILCFGINLYIVIRPIKEAYLKQNTNEVGQNTTLSVQEENQAVLNEIVQEAKTNEIKEEVIDTKEEIIAKDEKEEITTSSEATKKEEKKETQKSTQTKKNTETKKAETPKKETTEQPKQEETKQEEKKEVQKTIEVDMIGEYDIINGGYATYSDWFEAPEGWEY